MVEPKPRPAAGFAAIETVLVLIIIGIIAGVGYWVVTQRNNTTASTTSTNTPVTVIGQVTAKAGTLSAIDQLTTLDSQSEANIDTKYDSVDQTSAQSANTAASNIGGAYNEANF